MTRRLLASFLEYAVTGKTNAEEIRRFMTTSYDDPMMAAAVKEFRDLIPYESWSNGKGSVMGQSFGREAADRIYELARELRKNLP